MTSQQPKQHFESGFGLIEVIIVVLILGIITTISLFGITKVRSSFQLSNSARTLQAHLEKAISDAKRRNAKGNSRSTVRVLSANRYEIRIDADGDGNPEIQNIDLPQQIKFLYDPAAAPQATIDWRGNVAESSVVFVLKSDQGETSEIKLTGKGDASKDTEFAVLPIISVTPLSNDVKSSVIISGNSTPNPNISPTPTPTPLPFCIQNQKPAENNCRCQPGKVITSDGKCS